MLNPFSPTTSGNVKVTIASSSVAVDGTLTGTGNNVRVVNTGTIAVYVKTWGATATAADSVTMLPGTVEVFAWGGNTVSVLGTAATSSDVYFTRGEGV